MSCTKIVLTLLATIMLSSLVFSMRLDDEDAKCELHYSRNQLQREENCNQRHGHYKNMCNKLQCYKGLGETCASRDDEWGQLKHGICREGLTCGSCGQCVGCLDLLTTNGKPPCHECPMKLKYKTHDNVIFNDFKRNPKLANYDYNYEQLGSEY